MGAIVFYLLKIQKYISSKQKIMKWKKYSLCLGNITKGFTSIDMKKTGLNGYVYKFSVDYKIIDTSNIINIHQYLMKKHDIK